MEVSSIYRHYIKKIGKENSTFLLCVYFMLLFSIFLSRETAYDQKMSAIQKKRRRASEARKKSVEEKVFF